MSREGRVVCVTGASGYIASWLVKLLLHHGYTVKASVRDPMCGAEDESRALLFRERVNDLALYIAVEDCIPIISGEITPNYIVTNDPKKVEHLHSLDGAKERLHLFAANLLDEGSFDAAVEGCEGVFHTASPLHFDFKDPQAEFLNPAVKGTVNVLNSCSKVPSIKRVVLTSSMAAVLYNGKPLGPETVVDESWFSDPDFCRETKEWYALSKTLAEDVAWKFVKDNGVDMVTINPAIVVGPLLQPTLNASSSGIVELFNGSETYPNITFSWVHVKDIANAHIVAFELPSASGRYCLAGTVAHFSEAVKILRELYPDAILPQKCSIDEPLQPLFQVSQEKARSLGVDYIPFVTSLKETVDSLREKGFISF